MHQLIEKIMKEQAGFPAAQRLVAAYVVDNCYQIPFLSITALAKNIGVSETTVIKFCAQLGFGSFAEFKKVFADSVHSELVMYNKISESKGAEKANEGVFERVEREAVANVQATLQNPVNAENLKKLLPMMKKARNIYLLGGRSSAFLAAYFTHTLQYLGLPVHAISGGIGDYYDRISLIGPEDLVIVTCFQRYTALTVDLVRDLKSRNVPIVLITDSGPSSLYSDADAVFRCSISSEGYFPCYASYMALTNTICQAAAAYFETAPEYVRELEQKLLRLGVFM